MRFNGGTTICEKNDSRVLSPVMEHYLAAYLLKYKI
jgi:hypothetical protein